MNKTQLIDKVASRVDMSKAQAGRAVNAVFDEISDSLSKLVDVTIVGFGTLKVTQRAERTGRNPQTGKAIVIPAQKTIRFSAGKQLKEACNSDKK